MTRQYVDVRDHGPTRTVGDIGEDIHAYLLTGQRQSWDEIWPRMRTLTVS